MEGAFRESIEYANTTGPAVQLALGQLSLPRRVVVVVGAAQNQRGAAFIISFLILCVLSSLLAIIIPADATHSLPEPTDR